MPRASARARPGAARAARLEGAGEGRPLGLGALGQRRDAADGLVAARQLGQLGAARAAGPGGCGCSRPRRRRARRACRTPSRPRPEPPAPPWQPPWPPPCRSPPRGRARRPASRIAGSVSGSTPWPRLKMWPGRPPLRRSTRGLRSATTSHGARHTAGSRLPCTALSPDPGAGHVERHPPVDAHDVGAGLAHQRRAARRCRRRSGCGARRGRRRRRTPWRLAGSTCVLVVVAATSAPAHCRTAGRPGPPPRPASAARRWPGRPGGRAARRHSSGSPCISALVLAVGARRAALDEVAGHRERRPGEADERRRRQLADQDAARSRARRACRPRARAGAAGRGRPRTRNGCVDHRARCRGRRRRRSRWRRGHDDVAVEDGGVDAVAAHRLEGDLGGQLGLVRWRRGCCPRPGWPGTRAGTARPGA